MSINKNKSANSLFIPLVTEKDYHANFTRLLGDDCKAERKVLESWAAELLQRDGNDKFIKEFQTTFNSCFWEMYLNALFKFWNISIDYSKVHPDFVIQDYGGICIEAVIASNEETGIPEYVNAGKKFDPSLLPHFMNRKNYEEFLRKSIIRLSNSLLNKLNRYNESYEKESFVKGKPYIIAIAPFDRPGFWLQQEEPLLELLYGYKTNWGIDGYSVNKVSSVQKDNGAEIILGIFDDFHWENVSGIIFSHTATFSKVQALSESRNCGQNFFYSRYQEGKDKPLSGFLPKEKYKESVDDGIELFLNPNAKNPLPQEFFSLFPYVCFGFPYGNQILKVRDGALLSRTQQGIRIK